MSQHIFFAHANGFPSATYGKLFAALAPDYQVRHLAQHAHDPRFPVNENWQNLVDELLHHLAQQDAPVWGWVIRWAGCCTCMPPCVAPSTTAGWSCSTRRC